MTWNHCRQIDRSDEKCFGIRHVRMMGPTPAQRFTDRAGALLLRRATISGAIYYGKHPRPDPGMVRSFDFDGVRSDELTMLESVGDLEQKS